MNSLFATNPTNLEITRSKFKRPSNLKTTMNMGELVPIYVDEVLPGDTKQMFNKKLIRMATPVKPIMDNIYAQVYWFFVPNRTIFDNWEELQGANKSGPWTQQTPYTVPQITAPTGGWPSNSLADYMGLPVGVGGYSVSHLPFRAYVKIWNEWFRDENLQNFSYLNTGASNTTGSTANTNYVTDAITGGMCLPVSKSHDYFTSALPEPQKGPDVLLPLGEEANVIGNGMALGLTNGTNNVGLMQYNNVFLGTDYAYGQDASTATGGANKPNGIYGVTKDATKSGLIADLSNATAATINNLRQAFAIQRMYERDARGGKKVCLLFKKIAEKIWKIFKRRQSEVKA